MQLKWIMLTLLATLSTGCLWMITGGDKSLFPDETYKEIEYGVIETTKPVTPLPGMKLAPGTTVHFSAGRMRKIETKKEVVLDGIDIPGGSTITLNARGRRLSLASVVLGDDTEYGELEFRKGSELNFHDDGTPRWANLKGKHRFEGETYKTKTHIWFEDGEVVRSKSLAERQRQAEARARERRACRSSCAVFQGAAHARCVSGCN